MRNSVIIKNEQYGLRIVLNVEESWEQLLKDVREKFASSAGFFEDASLTLTFAGRKLTEKEEDQIIEIINEETRINILCVFVEDPERQGIFVRAANRFADEQEKKKKIKETLEEEENLQDTTMELWGKKKKSGGRYQMVLRSLHEGEIYKTQQTVIVIGNVEEGAALTTERDAIILGSARGVIRAGGDDLSSGRHFVASSDLRPKKISIDGVSMRTKAKLFSRTLPAIAAVKDGSICVVPFDGNMEELFS